MLSSFSKTWRIVSAVLIFLVNFGLQAKTLDDFVVQIESNQKYDPFVIGGVKAARHPLFSELMAFAKEYNTNVKWVPSVAQEVLRLPFHPSRMVIQKDQPLDGWFDELISPNRIILHDESAFITLIHELRHAVQLGTHGLNKGSEFDRLLQKNKRRIAKFHLKIAGSDLPEAEISHLKTLSTRLVESASEVCAHQGDVVLSRKYGHDDFVSSYIQYIEEYKDEFIESYKALKKNAISQNELFLDELYVGLRNYMKENDLRTGGLRVLK